MRRRLFIRLAARQEGDARHRSRHEAAERFHGALRHFLDAGALTRAQAWGDHVGFQQHAAQIDAGEAQFLEHRLERLARHVLAALDRVIARLAIGQHFGLDHRHDTGFLAIHGIAGERMGVGANAVAGGGVGGDGDDAAPLGEAGAELGVVRQPLAQSIEALGDLFVLAAGHRQGAAIHLDAGDHVGGGEQVAERRAVLGLLLQRLLGEDDAGDVVGHRGGGAEQHLAIVAAGFQRHRQADQREALGDGAFGFIGGENALAAGDELFGDCIERGHGAGVSVFAMSGACPTTSIAVDWTFRYQTKC